MGVKADEEFEHHELGRTAGLVGNVVLAARTYRVKRSF